jgi:MFS family permease
MGEPKWYRTIRRGQWLAMLAAMLGWMFDGFEMGLHPLAAKPALEELLAESIHGRFAEPGQTPSPEEFTRELGAAVGWYNALLTALFLFGAATGGFVFGWVGDVFGRTRALLLSILTYTLLTALGGFATAVWQLAALRFTSALGMGGEWSLGVALVMEVWPAAARPYLAGVIGFAGNLGYLIVASVSLSMKLWGNGQETSWRPLMFLGITPALLTLLIRLMVPESEKWKKAVAVGPKPSPIELFAPGLRRRTLLAIGLMGVALLGTWGAVQWIPLWASSITKEQVRGVREITQIWSAGGACVGSLAAALVAWRWGRRPVYFVLCLLSLAITACLFRISQEFGGAFLAQVFLVGLITAAFYGWAPLYLPELFPTRLRASGQGISYNFGRIVAGVGTLLLTGNLMERFKSDYAASLAVTSLIYVVGLVLIWFAPETKGQPLPD